MILSILYLQTYVQDLLKKNADEIIELLMESQAHFYVCGDISMAADVYRTLEVGKYHNCEDNKCLYLIRT